MSKRTKYTAEEKYKILMDYENGTESMLKIASMYRISEDTLRNWIYNFEKYGLDGLRESKTWKAYSNELKEAAVIDYISSEYSLREVVKKCEISDKSLLKRWISKYNSHRETTSPMKGMNRSMTKKSTSLEEKIEIVFYCIDHNKNYQYAAETYHVSYQQVYQWVKKYESGGENELKDRRGHNKNKEELTPEDIVNLEIKKIKIENERLRMENEFLKKLDELERRRV